MIEIKQTIIRDDGNVVIMYDDVKYDDDMIELSRDSEVAKFVKGDDTSGYPRPIPSICRVAWDYKPAPKQKVIVKEEDEEVSRTEIVEIDGKYVQKTFTETITKQVEEPQWEEVPLYGEDGEQLMRLVSESIESKEAVLDEDGNEIEEAVDAQDAVYEGIVHRIPIMD